MFLLILSTRTGYVKTNKQIENVGNSMLVCPLISDQSCWDYILVSLLCIQICNVFVAVTYILLITIYLLVGKVLGVLIPYIRGEISSTVW